MAINDVSGSVKSATRALDILTLLVSQQRPMAASEIAQALSIPVSSLSYLMITLADLRYIERSGRRYLPGPALAQLQPAGGDSPLPERVAPLVRAIRKALNETTGFFVRRGFNVEVVASEIGLQALRYTLDVGQQAPLHAFAAGKALLAALDDQALEDYLRHSTRQAFTAGTLVEAEALRANLEEVRACGFARTWEEHTPGIAGIALAASVNGRVVGAFSVAMPLVRLTPDLEARAKEHLSRAASILDGGIQSGAVRADPTAAPQRGPPLPAAPETSST